MFSGIRVSIYHVLVWNNVVVDQLAIDIDIANIFLRKYGIGQMLITIFNLRWNPTCNRLRSRHNCQANALKTYFEKKNNTLEKKIHRLSIEIKSIPLTTTIFASIVLILSLFSFVQPTCVASDRIQTTWLVSEDEQPPYIQKRSVYHYMTHHFILLFDILTLMLFYESYLVTVKVQF